MKRRHLLVRHPVISGVAVALDGEGAEGLEAKAIPLRGLVVRVDDLAEGVPDRELDRITVAGRRAPPGEVGVEEAQRILAEAPKDRSIVAGLAKALLVMSK